MSLLALTGMFIFGGKKEKKKRKSYEEILKEAEERYGVPADTIKELSLLYVFNAGLPRLVRHAHPEKDLGHVMKITGSVDRGDNIYISSIRDAKWHKKASDARDPRAVKFVLLHPFIALILSHHSSAETSTIGKAVSDALNVFYGQMGKTYEDAKKEQDKLIDYIVKMAEFNHIPIVKEKLREQLKQGLPKAFKIVDKLLPDNSKEHAMILRDALDYDVQNSVHILKQAGIEVEPELEEFRQFLAEISGKKIEPKKPSFPEAEKTAKEPKIQTNPYSLTLEAQKLLGILNGLKYAGYSKEAVGSAVEDMLKRAEELAEKGELEVLALYLWTAHLLREGRFDDAEKFLKKES